MTPLFFFGTLRDRELLEIVLGRPVGATEMRAARAPGHAARRLEGQAYPHLVEEPGATAEGVVFAATDSELERICYFEEAEYGLSSIRVDTPDGPVDARYFRATGKLAPGEGTWDIDAWRREARPVAIEAARELMAHYGLTPVERMDDIWPGIMTRAKMRARARAARPATGNLRRPRGPEDVRSLGVGRPYTAFFAVEEHRLQHRLYDGGWSKPMTRAVAAVGDAVTILPYDPGRDLVLLVEQFRAPMFSRGDACPWGVEAIAGRIDAEIGAESTARREAREEAGLELGRVEQIAAYYPTPGILAEHVTSFVAEADLGDAGGLHGEPSEHEDIRALTCTLDEALEGISSGEIDNAPAVLSLLWLARNRERLRAEWGAGGLERSGPEG